MNGCVPIRLKNLTSGKFLIRIILTYYDDHREVEVLLLIFKAIDTLYRYTY
jgi:hypothetical protein